MHFSLRHVACTRTRPLARPAAATTAASLPSPLTHDAHSSPRPVCRPGAGVGVVTAPPQHASWPRAGRPWRPLTGPSGPQPPPHAAGEGRAGCGRVGGVCCVRAAASAAGGAAGRPPRAHRLGGRLGAISHRARSTLLGASNGTEAAPGGLGLDWRWATVTPGPASPPGTRLWRRRRRPHALMCVHAIFMIFRDCARLYVW